MSWTEALLSLGVGTGGLAAAGHVGLRIVHEVARWQARRAGAEEVTAVTVQRAMDELRGLRSRLEEEAEKARASERECWARYEELKRVVASQQREIEDLRSIIRTGRGTLPPIRLSTFPSALVEDTSEIEKEES